MGDFLAAMSGLKISDAKASIVEELKRMQKWRDSQRQEFQSKQLMEHQKSLQTEKNFEKYYGNNKETLSGSSVSSITDQSQSVSEVSLQDQSSSINGHMLNCFSDSSHDSSTFYRNNNNTDNPVAPVSNGNTSRNGYSSLSDISSRNPHLKEHYMSEDISTAVPNQPASKRPARPFLRKRAGLERYKPKKRTNTVEGPKLTIEEKTDFPQRKVILKLKPAIHSSTSPPRKANHVKFCEPIQVCDHETTNPKQLFHEANKTVESQNRHNYVEESESENISTAESQELEDKSVSSDISLNSETKELAEFELLENCAQNSSFNSDSSVVQRVLNGETLKPFQNLPQNSQSHIQNFNYIRSEEKSSEKAVNFTNLKDLNSRQQCLEDFISNIEPKIISLQKDVTKSNKSSFEEYSSHVNERCSTPVEDTAILSDYDSSKNSSASSIIFVPHNEIEKDQHNTLIEDKADKAKYQTDRDYLDEKDVESDSIKQNEDFNRGQIDKSKLRVKMEELEKEIQNYQTERKHLDTISKERDLTLKQLKKERDEFQKTKEEWDALMESQKKELKREKDSFNRLKKATLDHRNRREREDLSTLKQEVEKLQKELKKERIKFNNETRKLKSQLNAAERERDNLKLQNMTLEDQIEDLVAALKVRIALEEKTEDKSQTKSRSKTEKGNNVSNGRKGSDNQDNRISSDTSDNFKEVYVNIEQENISDSNITKPKVRFNLPQFNENFQSSCLSDSGIGSSNEKHLEINGSHNNDLMTKSTVGSDFIKPPYEEIQHDDRVERIYNSGEVDIFFPSGTRKHVSADGQTIKFFYSNGDEKEIFPDKRTIYRFVNGDIEKRFPSGLVITELVNGQIQKQNSDGSKEVTFPDGSFLFIRCDGTQEIVSVDGTVARVDPDGTETIEFKNGEKEIRKDSHKRREYPDGSIKIIYKSGRQETRYANGRIKIKDTEGNLLIDTKHLKDITGNFE